MISGIFNKKTLIPALIGAGVCLFFLRGGFFAFFFLIPPGFLLFRYDCRTACVSLVLTLAGRILVTAIMAVAFDVPSSAVFFDLLYFTITSLLFVWISSPPPFLSFGMSGSVRLMAGSCAGALLFTGIFFRSLASPAFSDEISSLIDTLISFGGSSGSDVVENALWENLTPALVLDLMKDIMLRGGSLISCITLFFVSRQISLALVRVTRRERGTPVLASFRVYPVFVWVFSVSLLLVVLSRVLKIEIMEIVLWNILILCVMLYLAQGLAIFQFFLSRPSTPPPMRMLLGVLFVFVLFSPVLNTVLFAGLVLLGIAENWLPLRAVKINGPPSTPEAGDGGI